jgi:dihydroxy-acid dehydratase
LDVELTDAEIDNRRKEFKPKEIRYKSGVLAKYAKLVTSASTGAVTD